MGLKWTLGSLVIVGLSIVLLWHFACIWMYGEYFIVEPSKTILITETCGIVILLGFGIYLYAHQLRIRQRK